MTGLYQFTCICFLTFPIWLLLWHLCIAAWILEQVCTNANHQQNLTGEAGWPTMSCWFNILKSLLRTQHTPVTFFQQGNSRSPRVKTPSAISNEVIKRHSLFQLFEILASRHSDTLNDVKHSDGRCLLVLGKTVIDRSYLSTVQFWTANAAPTTNRRLYYFLTRVSLKYVLVFLMAVMCCPCSCQTYVSRLSLSLCLPRSLSRFNSAVFAGCWIKALWACRRTF